MTEVDVCDLDQASGGLIFAPFIILGMTKGATAAAYGAGVAIGLGVGILAAVANESD